MQNDSIAIFMYTRTIFALSENPTAAHTILESITFAVRLKTIVSASLSLHATMKAQSGTAQWWG